MCVCVMLFAISYNINLVGDRVSIGLDGPAVDAELKGPIKSRDLTIIDTGAEVPIPVCGWAEDSKQYWECIVDTTTFDANARAWLKRVMKCESTYRSYVCNSSNHCGLFQFDQSTWNENCHGDRLSGYDSVNCALAMYYRGMQGRWECK